MDRVAQDHAPSAVWGTPLSPQVLKALLCPGLLLFFFFLMWTIFKVFIEFLTPRGSVFQVPNMCRFLGSSGYHSLQVSGI